MFCEIKKILFTPAIKYILIIQFLFIFYLSKTQSLISDTTISFYMISFHGGVDFPQFDLKKRFGTNGTVGISVSYKNLKNFFLKLEGNFYFGNNVKEDNILTNISTKSGQIIKSDGQFANVLLYERGYSIYFNLGKVFPLLNVNPNSGFFISTGAGLLRHKIRIETGQQNIPVLTKDLKKGYDRLSFGFSTNEKLGYFFFSNKKLINFSIAIEYIQAWTSNKRKYNYDTMDYDNNKRFDGLLGFKFSWIFLLYKSVPEKYYYYY